MTAFVLAISEQAISGNNNTFCMKKDGDQQDLFPGKIQLLRFFKGGDLSTSAFLVPPHIEEYDTKMLVYLCKFVYNVGNGLLMFVGVS